MAKVLLQVITALILVAAAYCCRCLPATWPEHYCRAEFVARITVFNNGPDIGRDRTFRVYVHGFYKSTINPAFVNRDYLFTADNSAACGTNFEAGRSYIITGSYTGPLGGIRRMRTNSCNYQRQVSGYRTRITRPVCRGQTPRSRRSRGSRD